MFRNRTPSCSCRSYIRLLYPIFSKASVCGRLISPHWILIACEFNHYGFPFPRRNQRSPSDFQYPMKSDDTLVDWVSNKPAFLTLYNISPASSSSIPFSSLSLSCYSLYSLLMKRCLSRSEFIARTKGRLY